MSQNKVKYRDLLKILLNKIDLAIQESEVLNSGNKTLNEHLIDEVHKDFINSLEQKSSIDIDENTKKMLLTEAKSNYSLSLSS